MVKKLSIGRTNGEVLSIPLESGRPLYVVGPNGSGKSALIQHTLMQLGAANVRRISAHRQTYLESAAIDMTPHARKQFDEQLTGQEPNPIYRWREYNSGRRLSSVLYDLNAMDDDQARRMRDLYYQKEIDQIDAIVKGERPVFDRINLLLQSAGLEVTIERSSTGEILAKHLRASMTYSLAQMSDGERNAVILAANVLTVAPGIVLLIDEPERHLHRSIIEPLLSALFAERLDCPFVVSTHEIALPLANPESEVLILRSCTWNGDRAQAWDAKLLECDTDLPEEVKRAILGSRRRILFVEGDPSSPDLQLYSLLFPEASVMPAESCDKVIDAVTGLRNSVSLHDVEAFGIIDGDNRSADNKEELSERGIYALDSYSIESIYFCLDAIRVVCEWQALALGDDADEMLESAKVGALGELAAQGIAERMSARRCERRVRSQIELKMPTWKSILEQQEWSIEMDTQVWLQDELARFRGLLSASDLEGIVARYPVRESNVIDAIVKPLKLDRENYRKTLLSRVRQDPELAEKLRKRIEPLASAISSTSQGCS